MLMTGPMKEIIDKVNGIKNQNFSEKHCQKSIKKSKLRENIYKGLLYIQNLSLKSIIRTYTTLLKEVKRLDHSSHYRYADNLRRCGVILT